jgi:predicted nucleic acid-binding protein
MPQVSQAKGLIDTGALLALLDRDDKWHRACVAAFEKARLPLATTAAVLTELFHLLGNAKRDQAAAWQLLESGAILVYGIDDSDLSALRTLMERYHDRPMDFADATLVHLGAKLSLADIVSIDHDDFETYRMPRRRKFRVQPPRQSLR